MRISSISSTRRRAAGLYQSLRRLPSAQRAPCPRLPFATWKIGPPALVLTISPSPRANRAPVSNRVGNQLIRTTVAIAAATALRTPAGRFTGSSITPLTGRSRPESPADPMWRRNDGMAGATTGARDREANGLQAPAAARAPCDGARERTVDCHAGSSAGDRPRRRSALPAMQALARRGALPLNGYSVPGHLLAHCAHG